MDRTLCLLCLLLLWNTAARASQVDTLQVESPSMHKTIKVVYIVPDKALGDNPVPCPTVYLLHGYGGNAETWITLKPNLPDIADEKGMIFVCPDGLDSWYWDSPVNPAYRYETFISSELVTYTDEHFATVSNRKARAISGLSMGGHGALWNAIRHKDVFGAAASMSGGVDIRPFPDNWNMKSYLGEYDTHKDVWDAHTVINQIATLKDGDLALIIDCGEEDFFLEVNKALHQCLLANKISHDFITRPGGHTSEYWNNSIDYHLLFFYKYFNK